MVNVLHPEQIGFGSINEAALCKRWPINVFFNAEESYEDFPGAATRLWRPGTEKKAHPLCSASTATSKRVLYIEEVPIGRNLGGGWRAAVMTWRKTMHMPRQKEPQ